MTGYPIFEAILMASSMEYAAELGNTGTLLFCMASLKSCLSSVRSIPFIGVPRTFILYFFKMPSLDNDVPQFSAVCPPKDNIMESGLSSSRTLDTYSLVIGSRYTLSENLVSVWIVATLGLIKTVLILSSLRALRHCEPE